MADNHFDLVQVWDQLGGAVRVRRNGTATVVDPATGNPLTVVENGVSTTVVHSDSAGRVSFVAQQGTAKLISGGVSTLVTSSEAATSGATNAALAQSAQAAAETARNAAQTARDQAATSAATASSVAAGKSDKTEVQVNPKKMLGRAATAQLTLPTPASPSGGEATHPSVLYVPDGWNGYRYWMAMTPYPAGSDAYEDPCIIASNDGTTWVVPAGLTNPLDDLPGSPNAYNSDVNLTWGPDGTTMHLFWRTYDPAATGAEEKLYLRTSTNGTTWTTKQLVMANNQTVRRLVSPAFLYDGGQWVMWAVDTVPAPKRMVYSTASSVTGPWSTPTPCTLDAMISGEEPWHAEIRRVGGQLVGIIACCTTGSNGGSPDLMAMTSVDGLAWKTTGRPLIPKAVAGLHDQLYKASMVPAFTPGGWFGFDLFYSGYLTGPPAVWRICRTSVRELSRIARQVTIGATAASANTTVAVTFEAGIFDDPPAVLVTADSTRLNVSASSVTATGCNIIVTNWTTAATAAGTTCWITAEAKTS